MTVGLGTSFGLTQTAPTHAVDQSGLSFAVSLNVMEKQSHED